MFRVYDPVRTSNNTNPYLAICEIFDISKPELARVANVSLPTVNKWISSPCDLPDGRALLNLQSDLGISIDCLLDGQIVLLEDDSRIPWHMPVIPSAIVLKNYRMKKCLSISDFSNMLGIPVDDIISYETGHLLPYDDAMTISEKCGIPMELLFDYIDYNDRTPDNRKKAIIALVLQYSSDMEIISKLLNDILTEKND